MNIGQRFKLYDRLRRVIKLNIEERAKDDLIWLKDNWVIDWAEPEQSKFKFAIEDIIVL